MNFTGPIGKTQALAGVALFLGSVGIVASSLGFEHIGGYEPCALCHIQRNVHYAMVPSTLVLLLLIWRSASPLFIRLGFILLGCLLGYGWAVGIYQAGAEWEFWLGPNCTSTSTITQNAGDLLSQMQSTKLVSCTVAQLRILGLSFGGWNVVLSTILGLIALAGALLKADSLSVLFAKLPFLNSLIAPVYRA